MTSGERHAQSEQGAALRVGVKTFRKQKMQFSLVYETQCGRVNLKFASTVFAIGMFPRNNVRRTFDEQLTRTTPLLHEFLDQPEKY